MLLIKEISAHNLSIWAEQGKLKLAFGNASPDPQLVNKIKANKPELIAFLSEQNIDSAKAFRRYIQSQTAPSRRIESVSPANSLQQGFIYHHLNQPDDDAYRVQMMLDYQEPLNVPLYQKAWELTSLRFPALRTFFNWDETLLQIVSPKASIDSNSFYYEDISALGEAERGAKIDALQQAERAKGFDLSKPGLIRISLIKQADDLYTLLKTEHHSISDGWSAPLLLRSVHEYYEQLLGGTIPTVEVETAYLATQQYYQQNQAQTQQYWLEKKLQFEGANDISGMLSAPLDLTKPMQVTEPDTQQLMISGAEFHRLKSMCQNAGVTLNVALQFCWHKLIQVYAGDEQTTVGTVVSGRNLPVDGIDHSVGLFINTLPLQVFWPQDASCAQIMTDIQLSIASLNSASSVALAELQPQGERLFHTLFTFENYPINHQGDTRKWQLKKVVEKIDYPLSIVATEQGDTLDIAINYSANWLDTDKATKLVTQLKVLLEQLVDAPEQPHQQLGLLTPAECEAITQQWHCQQTHFEFETDIAGLIAQHAQAMPDKVAVKAGETSLSYHQLNERAEHLANNILQRLTQQGESVQADTLIGLYLSPSAETLVAMVAVLKLGAGYVPISPDAPEDRVQFILADTDTRLVLTQSQYAHRLDTWLTGTQVGFISCDKPMLVANNPQGFAERRSRINNIAYVIYTSGTTGKPKGVMVEQGQVLNYFFGVQSTLLDALDVTDFSTNYCFDLTVTTTLCPLMAGGTVCVYQDDIANVSAYQAHLTNNQVRFVKTTPSLANILLTGSGITLRSLMVGGEALTKPVIDKLSIVTDTLIDEYGPTEATVGAMNKRVDPSQVVNGIGHAYPNVALYVLSSVLKPVPVGAIGELYIGGAGVARGYLNREDLTQSRFIKNPFVSSDDTYNQRIYKTGDLVRWLDNGEIEYLGRNDNQVKIRGYRIELGEIEHAICDVAGVHSAAVIADKSHADGALHAYWIASADSAACEEDISAYLGSRLPKYMLPASFTRLDVFPLTGNGKLDEKALPIPNQGFAHSYKAPSSELESTLCELWQQVLNVDTVGVDDNFYTLGGNSITAIRLSAASRKALKRDIPLEMLFTHNTVAKLAKVIDASQAIVIPRSDCEVLPLSFAQERLLFIDSYEKGSSAYHIPALFEVGESLNLSALQQALNQVVARHEVLNSVFNTRDDGVLSQCALRKNIAILQHTVVDEVALAALVSELAVQPFELSKDSPMRVYHICCSSTQYLLFVWHHIAFDGWSTFVFTDELTKAYIAALDGKTAQLPELSIRYADYAKWQRDYLQGETLNKLQSYWTGALKGFETLELPYDRARPSQVSYAGENLDLTLDKDLSKQVVEIAKAHQTSVYTVMLSAFYVTLASVSGQQDIVVGTPSDNRHHSQVQALIGFFVNSMALRSQVDKQASASEFIQHTHQLVTQAKVHQELPFEQVVELLELERDSSRHPIFQVMFSVQSMNAESIVHGDMQLTPVLSDMLNAKSAKYDLTLMVDDSAEQLGLQFNYATSLFEKVTIDALAGRYLRILKSMLAAPSEPLHHINVLSDVERTQLLEHFNAQPVHKLSEHSIQRVFEQVVQQHSNDIAVVCGDEQLSYQQLNNRANQLARCIRQAYETEQKSAIKPDTLIALYYPQNIDMVVAILAVLKAGAAYVPLSMDNPDERTRFIVDDANVPLILTHADYYAQVSGIFNTDAGPRVLVAEHVGGENTANLDVDTELTSLAYVIYTSGTTGQPKGVEIEHHAVNSFALGNNYLDASKVSNIASMSSYAFDGFIFDAMFSLLNGLCVHLVDKYTRLSPELFAQYVLEHDIDASFMTTALFNALATSGQLKSSSLKHILFGGEQVNLNVVNAFKQSTPQVKLSHVYGPTETTVFASVCHLDDSRTNAPIGHALTGKTLYVLDSMGNPVPVGTPGELYIGGEGLARGYLNRPELTAEKFVENPFVKPIAGSNAETRMYRTGDIVRWQSDGNIEYVGRNDKQVKIRGFRIELGEIESAICSIAGVKQTAVIAKQNGTEKYLAAYVVSDDTRADKVEQILDYLQSALPDFMVPSAITLLDKIPLNVNGKLDVKSLPEPNFISSDTYVEPRDALELKLCELWQSALSHSQIGISDDYFKLGGTSIAAIKLTQMINQTINCKLSVADLFNSPTVQGLASLIRNQARDGQLVKRLNNFKAGLPTLVMIHAGSGGCEVYQGLAAELSGSFNCLGIDNYNLINDQKISQLDVLAKVYYDEVCTHIELDKVQLVGWSLGGNIALEMAGLFERNHNADIKVLLLDTIIKSGKLKLLTQEFESENEQLFITRMQELGHGTENIDAMIKARKAEGLLDLCPLTQPLKTTQVHLLKAGQYEAQVSEMLTHEWSKTLDAIVDNNVGEFVGGKVDYTLLTQRNHGDILQSHTEISRVLSNMIDTDCED
ncbi:non-ribosomal peptide synthetase [Pseudoalteromonas luteoviolacea]|uniref:Amino acid adenylation domain/amino acid adenylation domain protein n=1 Tax=Pseudoalteromonas luteoviolacea (strain 2ta16) TaxID=1353533 RepID=V4H3X9_PSEL2|nr:non-ribosomal peptide synthetase [Pseudoalteromonas luteoviolacea]ESP92186.1 amino acid adenylation domain/amino acid adenylation domain protein [Pseudoalteromonas luteoviolacea 2ta16]KZN29292.1 hypothetical protein N483_07610 [Pseudoalteromonas luteoviolacea NCIMB 1944]